MCVFLTAIYGFTEWCEESQLISENMKKIPTNLDFTLLVSSFWLKTVISRRAFALNAVEMDFNTLVTHSKQN